MLEPLLEALGDKLPLGEVLFAASLIEGARVTVEVSGRADLARRVTWWVETEPGLFLIGQGRALVKVRVEREGA